MFKNPVNWRIATATRVAALAVTLTLMSTASVRADSVYSYSVSFDTTGLAAAAAGGANYALALQFDDPTGDNSSVTISDFSSGNSVPAGSIQFAYGNTGDLTSPSLLLPGAGSFSALVQDFTPGNSLSFNVSVSTDAAFVGPTPNEFTLSIVDPNTFVNLATTDPNTGSSLLTIDTVPSSPPSLTTYDTTGGDGGLVLGGAVTPSGGAAAPLPSVAGSGVVLLGMVGVYAFYRRRTILPR